MFILMIRSTILYFVLLLVVRLMGKRQIGELQPFELVITLIIADLAILPMQETGMPIINGIVPLLTLVSVHFLISLLARKTLLVRKIVCGMPTIVINPDGIQYDKLKELNINMNDLEESLRGAGFFAFEEIEYAMVETNGKISVLSKANNRPVTPSDLKIEPKQNSLEVTLILDGKILKHNLQKMNLTEKFLNKRLKKVKITDISQLLIVTINSNGDMYFQEKNKKYIVLKTHYKGGSVK